MAKLAKAAVGFEHPAKGPNHCSQCRHFEAPHRCEIVEGLVAGGDWCERFARKSGEERRYGGMR